MTRQNRNSAKKSDRYTALVRIRSLHPWDVPPVEAIALQKELASSVFRTGDPGEVSLVAAADVAYVERAPAWAASTARAAVVVMSYPELEIVEDAVVEALVTFPYVPGLLSFREIPALALALERIEAAPDLLLVDGHGYSHPRRFGLASHLGLLSGVPTIGCAKSRLCGEAEEPRSKRGSTSPLVDSGETIGLVLRTKERVKPVYVSVGNNISLDVAAEWALRLSRTHRLPEPAWLADRLSKGRTSRRTPEPWTLDPAP